MYSKQAADAVTDKKIDTEDGISKKEKLVLSPLKKKMSRFEQHDQHSSEIIEKQIQQEKSKKRRKKTKRNVDSEHSELNGVYEDVTLRERMKELADDIFVITDEQVQPVAIVEFGDTTNGSKAKELVEYPSGFREVGRPNMLYKNKRSKSYSRQPPASRITTALDLAIQCQMATHGLFSVIHGLLAGVTICSCIFIHYLHSSPFTEDDFIEHYKETSYPLQTLNYILLVVCFLNALDRCDVGHSLKHFFRSVLQLEATALLVVLYATAFLLTLSVTGIENKFASDLYTTSQDYHQKTEFNATQSPDGTDYEVNSSEFKAWWIINLSRSVLVNIAWIVFALRPFSYNFLERLQDLPQETSISTLTL